MLINLFFQILTIYNKIRNKYYQVRRFLSILPHLKKMDVKLNTRCYPEFFRVSAELSNEVICRADVTVRGECATLEYLFIEDDFMLFNVSLKNRGVGTKVLNEVIQLAKKRGCKSIIGEMKKSNVNKLTRFYGKSGFKITGDRFRYDLRDG
ncbi:GNAT family N-acetyltransferase [Salmonella enterica]|nr:GNAT family N-acetyltransferase [Salmonella enterica subsp. enterica serovar Sandiego]EEP1514387.1 GNAT family N-acetyltransferase [Salmonella enterica]